MVAETRTTSSANPVPASPARKTADPDTDTAAWLYRWLQGFPNCIPNQADALTPKLGSLGFIAYASLAWMMLILLSASLPNMIVAEGLGSILAICKPHYGVTAIKVPIQKCYYRHPPASLPAPLQGTLPANERAAAAFHDHLADDMAEIKTMLYGVIKEKAEQKITLPTHYGVTAIKAQIQNLLLYRHSSASLSAPLQATLLAKERADATVHDTLALLSLMTWRRSRHCSTGSLKKRRSKR